MNLTCNGFDTGQELTSAIQMLHYRHLTLEWGVTSAMQAFDLEVSDAGYTLCHGDNFMRSNSISFCKAHEWVHAEDDENAGELLVCEEYGFMDCDSPWGN